MKTKILLIVAIMLLAALFLVSCGKKDGIEGKWKPEDSGPFAAMLPAELADKVEWEFTQDKHFNFLFDGQTISEYINSNEQIKDLIKPPLSPEMITKTLSNMTYEIDGDQLILISEQNGKSVKNATEFKIDGDKMTITDKKTGEALVFKRVK